VVTIGIGRDDPRRWVKVAYAIADAIERGETGPQSRLLPRSRVAAKMGVHHTTVSRAYRELTDMGIIYLAPGLGYFPNISGKHPCGRTVPGTRTTVRSAKKNL
jgi:DNA-binding GntR family transcriptional regulator